LDEVFWRGLFDIYLDPLAFVDAQYRVVRANIALAEALGCQPDALVGRACYEALNGPRCAKCPHAELLQDGCAHAGEIDFAKLKGCYWVSVTPVFDNSGLLLGSLHIARNVTAYKQLESELRAARDEVAARAEARERELGEHLHYQRALVALALGLSRSVSDAEITGHIQSAVSEVCASAKFAKCAFYRISGGVAAPLASAAADAQSLRQAAGEPAGEEAACVLAAAERGDVVHASAGDLTLSAVGLPPLWPGDAAYALLVVRCGAASAARLALSGERMWLLCQVMGDALRRQSGAFEAQRLRDELTRLDQVARLAQLFAALAHELNQPLAATLCNAQAATRLLAEDPPDLSEVGLALEDITASARRAGEVMRQTRALFKGGEYPKVPLCTRALVDGVVGLLQKEVALGGVELERRFDGETPAVVGDLGQLQQVLINLIKNAIDAVSGMPQERRRITIEVSASGDAAVALSVTDTGRGLPAGQEEQIFKPFYTDKPEGMGMGLSICRQIVTQHGGTIRAARAEGGGARLTVTLPRARL
jgi:signal transduction histidine kinase